MRRLILRNHQSPGDIVMLTAAVRDMAMFNAKWQMADVRTPCPALWENNPHLTPLADGAAGAEEFACGYPLIHRSNTGPWHFIHGFPPRSEVLLRNATVCEALLLPLRCAAAMRCDEAKLREQDVPKCNFGTRKRGTRRANEEGEEKASERDCLRS